MGERESVVGIGGRPPADVAEVAAVGDVAYSTPAELAQEGHRWRFVLAILGVVALKILGAWLLVMVRGLTVDEAAKFFEIDRGVTEYVLVGAVGYYLATGGQSRTSRRSGGD